MVISITMKAWYKKDYGQGGKSDEIEVNLSDSIIIYTHPGPFLMNAKKEQSISEILSADNINNNWFPHFNKIYRWYN